jgi:Uma2 family endonuclease
MAVPESKLVLTIEEYLTIERESEERHEYLDGRIYAMAGESPEHATICTNLVISIGAQLKGTSCQVWSKDTKVRSGPAPAVRTAKRGLFSYPDLVIVCGAPDFHDHHRDVVTNPKVIIEVLSPSTEAFDRGEKFLRYHNWNQTLTDYLLVAQTQPYIIHFTRRPDGSGTYQFYVGLEQCLHINSINCTLKLADIYDRIVFPPVEDEIEVESEAEC